ncbi:hypothetical protein JS578_11755 [Dysgonomonadaceae bacterium zrk40]|nr:hypothetical protein JS578_11755 [Dysgonomonadaceae bacterium zrk40]
MKKITEKEILETFNESTVLIAFEKLTAEEQTEIIRKIASTKSDDKQIKSKFDQSMMLNYLRPLKGVAYTFTSDLKL